MGSGLDRQGNGLKRKSDTSGEVWSWLRLRTLHRFLQSDGSPLRNGIPELASAEVNVVDAEEVHVLDVPRECRSPHPEIQVRRVHAWQAIGAGQDPRQKRRKVRNVPCFGLVRKEGSCSTYLFVSTIVTHKATEAHTSHVSAVPRRFVQSTIPPVLALKLLAELRCVIEWRSIRRQPF